MTLNAWVIGNPVRIDCSSAADHLESLSEAIQAAGSGQFSAFKLISELKRKRLRLILEEMPRDGEMAATAPIGISHEGLLFAANAPTETL